MGALATKTAGILSSSSPHEVFGGALNKLGSTNITSTFDLSVAQIKDGSEVFFRIEEQEE
ncbi:MAG: hypothetical protein ACI8XO_001650 [Verrucomicrobiales bacterium]